MDLDWNSLGSAPSELQAQGVERDQIIGPPFMSPPATWVLEECREPGESDEAVTARINNYLATIWRGSLN